MASPTKLPSGRAASPAPSTTPSGRSRRGIAPSASSGAGSADLDGQHFLIHSAVVVLRIPDMALGSWNELGCGDEEIVQSNSCLFFDRLHHLHILILPHRLKT